MPAFWSLALFCLIIHGATTLQWGDNPPDGSLQYACAGDSVSFPWSCTLALGEVLEDVQWFYTGSLGSEMIAVMTNRAFLPLQTFAQRVSYDNNAGIVLNQVCTADSGNYSVEVSGRGSDGDFFKFRRTVVLQVGADLMTTDGQLHVYENPVAVLDPLTKKWSVELHCGTFTYLGQPPFDVEWIAVLNNSRYEDSQFKLSLSQPIEGGNYTCRIPVPLTHTACLASSSGSKSEASYMLDEMRARLTLLEAHQSALQKTNDALTMENTALKIRNYDLTDRVHALEVPD